MPLDAAFGSPLFWLLAVTGVVLTGISKSGFAGGAGVVAVPLMALLIPVPTAIVIMLPLLLLMDIRSVQLYWRHVDWPLLRRILPAAILGIAIGALFIGRLSESQLQLLLGSLCLVFSCWGQLNRLLGRLPGSAWIWGTLSGISSTLLHAGGPPINIYLIARRLPKLQWLATVCVFFGAMNSLKILPYTLLGQWHVSALLISLLLLPAALLGVWLGYLIQAKVDEQRFLLICRLLLFASGLMLLLER